VSKLTRPLRCTRRSFASVLIALWVGQSDLAHARISSDAAQQLIDSTSFVNVLRTDAEQASLIADQLPEELPAELRSDLRRVLDRNLGYDRVEGAVVRTVAAKLAPSELDRSLRWWSSGPGRAISRAESSAYAALFPGSSFQAFNPANGTPEESNTAAAAKVATDGHFAGFVTGLLASTGAARSCLPATMNLSADCAHQDAASDVGTAQMAQYVETKLQEQYLRTGPGDLDAYIAYLSSSSGDSAGAQIRAASSGVLRQAWQNALREAADAIDHYARAMAGSSRQATLRQTVDDIDESRNLRRADFVLQLLRRAGPPDPQVLVQLARVTLKRAANLTSNDIAPSVPQIDPTSLQAAERLLDQALTLDPQRAETLMLRGHVAYLKRQYRHSVELLEQAKAIGTDNPWLQINLGDALWASAYMPPKADHALAQRAAGEFEAALEGKLPSGAEARALHQLGPIYAELEDIPKADSFYRRYASLQEGRNKAFALTRYAHFLLFYAHDVDAAVVAARQAVQLADFGLGRTFLAQVLTIKAGALQVAGRPLEARPYIAEARQIEPDLESLCPDLARLPAMLPGVFGIHAAGLAGSFSGGVGGRTLVRASSYATAKEIEQMLAWGANPNFFDPEDGTPLHTAILGNNAAAVRVLLEHGANPLTPFIDGRVPSQLTDEPSDTTRTEILALVRKAAGGRGALSGAVGIPLKIGYEYQLKKPIGVDGWGFSFPVGDRVIFLNSNCQYTDAALACLILKSVNDTRGPLDVAVPKDHLVRWTDWFKELGPSKQN
jgi:tetratricopeptide (TPR) repeat protein